MGSFFNTVRDPVGAVVSRFVGPNSWVAKEEAGNPLAKVSGAISPQMAQTGQAYQNRMNVTSTPTPYAGMTPTLQDANNGYVNAAAQARQKLQQSPYGTANPQQSAYQV